jgi:peptidoglycan/xylan/chitin deacetylase (PgdA/CDA1 family)
MSAVVQSAPATRWRPSPFVMASIAVHVGALAAALLGPEHWIWWALGAVGANQVALVGLGLWPRSTWLGPNVTRLPAAAAARGEIALTFDDGPDPEVTLKVLDLLDAHGARATFFCIAEHARRHPGLVNAIARRGHAVENHSCGHQVTFSMMGLAGIRKEIVSAQGTLTELAGRAPHFFRPPAGLRNPLLDPVLHEQGLKLVSWTRRGFDTVRADPDRVAATLLEELAAGDILLMHDGHSAYGSDGTPVVLAVLPRLLDAARRKGLRLVTLGQAIDP